MLRGWCPGDMASVVADKKMNHELAKAKTCSRSQLQPRMTQKPAAGSNRHNRRYCVCRLFSRLFLGSLPPSPPGVATHHRISSPRHLLSPLHSLDPCTRGTRSFALASSHDDAHGRACMRRAVTAPPARRPPPRA
jgi:hypothetical protein